MDRIGPYRLLSEVARGGVGAVHRALAPDGREVALKVLLAGRAANAVQRRRFANEVRALLRLRHPGVVALLDAGEHQGAPYLVMEWIAGESLATRLERQGPLPAREAASLVERLARALDHVHARGVLHRDLKPGNILFRRGTEEPLLTDFGLAREVEANADASVSGTVRGQWLGTPGYWPPEQARGDLEAVGPRSDVYGLGALLFTVLTGAAPQGEGSLPELLSALERPPRRPSSLRPDVPGWLDDLCVAALDPDPARRPSSAAAMAAALARASPRATRSRRVRLALLACAGALAILSGWSVRSAIDREEVAPLSSQVESLLWEGQAHLEQGDLSGAEACLARAKALDPSYPYSLRLSADIAAARSDLTTAIGDYTRALELLPDDPSLLRDRSMLLRRRGDPEGALRDLDRAVAVASTAWGLRIDRSALRKVAGDLRGAQEDAERALELDPAHARSWAARAEVRQKLGDVEGALADLECALHLDPTLPGAHALRGLCFVRLDRFERALPDLERAVALEPENPTLWGLLGLARRGVGDPRGAIPALERGLELEAAKPSIRMLLELAMARQELGDLQGALTAANRGLSADPVARDRASLLALRAELWLRLDEPAKALQDCDEAIPLGEDGLVSRVLRSRAREGLGDLRGALEDAKHALSLCSRPRDRALMQQECDRLSQLLRE